MTRIVVGPFNRVEGDLEVTLEIADGRIASARVNSPLYRGFEEILLGKAPQDALVLVPRICGICSVAQSAASAAALRDAMGLVPAPNGERVSALVQAAENIADHFTHFYLFFMPDFARAGYAGQPWHASVQARFEAVRGSATAEALPARASFLELLGLLAGKWPHTLALQPGGVSRGVSAIEKVRMLALLRHFRVWLERHLFADALETVAALDSEAALWRWFAAGAWDRADLPRFLHLAQALNLAGLGRASDRFMSFGAYAVEGTTLFPAGVWRPGAAAPGKLDSAAIREDAHHSWMEGDAPLHPFDGLTRPSPDKPGAYTWCKAPRLGGEVVECGALARQVVAGHPLARDLAERGGGNVFSRVVARMLEIARLMLAMEGWVAAIRPGEPFCTHAAMPDEAQGVGMVEAARGALGHWLVVRRGRIARYQIIAPTTWNFSPRDATGRPGALEQALVGIPLGEGGAVPLAVQHVVRAFDPCMVCTVH